MNKVGIHFGYWVRDWDVDYSALLPRTRQAGFDILEVDSAMVAGMSKTERNRLKGQATDNGIEFTYIGGLSRKNDLASLDATARRNGIRHLIAQAQLVKDMGGKSLSGVLCCAWPTSDPEAEKDRGSALGRSLECMREVMKVVEDYDLYFNMEVANRFEEFLLNTAQEAIDFVDRVGSSHCKILLDTFHINIEEDGFTEAITKVGAKMGHFHMGEQNRRPPGRGRIPWDEVFSALKSIGYTGPLVMEPFIMPGGSVGRDVRLYRDLLRGADLDEEARAACAFVKGKLAALK